MALTVSPYRLLMNYSVRKLWMHTNTHQESNTGQANPMSIPTGMQAAFTQSGVVSIVIRYTNAQPNNENRAATIR